MRRRDDRDRLFGDVDIKFQAMLIDSRKMFADEGFGLVADVEIHAVYPAFLDFMVNGAGDNVARRKLSTLVELVHEG